MDHHMNLKRGMSRNSTLTNMSFSMLGPMAPPGAQRRDSVLTKPPSLTSIGSLTSLKNMLADGPSMSSLMPGIHPPDMLNTNRRAWYDSIYVPGMSIPNLVRTQSTASQTGEESRAEITRDRSNCIVDDDSPQTPMPDVDIDARCPDAAAGFGERTADENPSAEHSCPATTNTEVITHESAPEVMPNAPSHEAEEAMDAEACPDEEPLDAGSFLPGPAPIEVLISFDTTGSMSAILDAVKNNIHEMLTRLFSDIPNLKVALLAHGDYCDEREFYLTKSLDLTGDLDALVDFLKNTDGTGGGDYEECYELILREARERFSWSTGTQRALVMIGDAVPHGKDDPANLSGLDWREQADKLYQELGIHMYAVHCRQEPGATSFWMELAGRTHGTYLQLNDLRSVVQTLMAICYREAGKQPPQHFGASGTFGEIRPSPEDPCVSGATPGTSGTKKTPKKLRVGFASKKPGKKPLKTVKKASKAKVKETTAEVKDRRGRASNVHSVDKVAKKAREIKKKLSSQKTTIRRPREVIPDAKTALSHLTWSPWRLALVPEGAAVSREEWLARRQGEPGLRRRTLFRSGLQKEALYEVAVQPAAGCKRYVTFLAATRGMPSDRRWETYILRSKKVNARISEVINQNCCLFIRRAFVPASASEVSRSFHHPLKKAALRDNDYAWNRARPRYISRRGIRM